MLFTQQYLIVLRLSVASLYKLAHGEGASVSRFCLCEIHSCLSFQRSLGSSCQLVVILLVRRLPLFPPDSNDNNLRMSIEHCSLRIATLPVPSKICKRHPSAYQSAVLLFRYSEEIFMLSMNFYVAADGRT